LREKNMRKDFGISYQKMITIQVIDFQTLEEQKGFRGVGLALIIVMMEQSCFGIIKLVSGLKHIYG